MLHKIDDVETQNADDVETHKHWDLSDEAHYRMWKARKALRLAFDECREAEERYTEAFTKAKLLDPDGVGC